MSELLLPKDSQDYRNRGSSLACDDGPEAEEIESLAEAIEKKRLEQLKAEIEAKIEAALSAINQLDIDFCTSRFRYNFYWF